MEDDDESQDPDFEPVEKSGSGEGTSLDETMRIGTYPDAGTGGDLSVDSGILEDSSEGGPTDEVLGGGKKAKDDVLSVKDGGTKKLDGIDVSEDGDGEEDEEDGESEMEDEEDEAEGYGEEEAVEEEVEESIPEEEKGEAREARLMAQKLKNRTDLRQERLKQIVQRYEARERRKGEEKKKARERYQTQLELFLGILPPAPPKTLHQLATCDRGALAEPRQEARRDSAARLVLNPGDTVVVDKAARVPLAEAVSNLRAGQQILIKLGSCRWSGAVRVGIQSLTGPRAVCIRGDGSSSQSAVDGSGAMGHPPRLVGRWEVETDAIGKMSWVMLMHNASGSPRRCATCSPRLAQQEHEAARAGGWDGDYSWEKDGMAIDARSSLAEDCGVSQEEAVVGKGQGGAADSESWPLDLEFGDGDVEYLKKQGWEWMLPLLRTVQLNKDASARWRPHRPRTVREALEMCDIQQMAMADGHIISRASPVFAEGQQESGQRDAAPNLQVASSGQMHAALEVDVRDISDVTCNIESAFWDFTGCQVRSAGGHALMLHGESRVCMASCKLGGSGTRSDAKAQVALTCVDASECALRDCVVELCDSGGVAALHSAAVGLETSALERCKLGLHLADAAQAGMVACSASAIRWGLVFVPEGGLLGQQLNRTSLCLHDCSIQGCDLFVGFGRSGDTDIQNTTITGDIDTIEVLRKKRLEGPNQSRPLEDRERQQVLAMHTEMVVECLAQAYRMRSHASRVIQ